MWRAGKILRNSNGKKWNLYKTQKISKNYEMKPHIAIVYMWRILNIKLVFIMPTARTPISSSEMIALSDDDDAAS